MVFETRTLISQGYTTTTSACGTMPGQERQCIILLVQDCISHTLWLRPYSDVTFLKGESHLLD